jgi:membrane protease YdiL (CAAX protease family)
MNPILNPNNHLFNLARSGRRLPHLILASVLSFVFVIAAQLVGGIPAGIIIVGLSMLRGSELSLDNPNTLVSQLSDTPLERTILLVLTFGPIFLILGIWLAVFEKRPLWTIGMELKGIGAKYFRGALIGLLMFSAAIGLSAVLGYVAFETDQSQPQGVAAFGGVLLVLLGWVVQGAAEEAITRGWLLPVIGARYKPLLGIALSAVIFTLFHSLNPNLGLIALLNLFLFGIFAALYALYEGGLWGIFSIHTVWNWAQGNLFGFEVSGLPSAGGTLFNLMEVGPDIITGGRFGPEGGLAVTAVLIIGCITVWMISKRNSL